MIEVKYRYYNAPGCGGDWEPIYETFDTIQQAADFLATKQDKMKPSFPYIKDVQVIIDGVECVVNVNEDGRADFEVPQVINNRDLTNSELQGVADAAIDGQTTVPSQA